MRGQISLFYASKPLKELKHQLLMLHCKWRKQVICVQQNGFSLKCGGAMIFRRIVPPNPKYTNGLITLKVCSIKCILNSGFNYSSIHWNVHKHLIKSHNVLNLIFFYYFFLLKLMFQSVFTIIKYVFPSSINSKVWTVCSCKIFICLTFGVRQIK